MGPIIDTSRGARMVMNVNTPYSSASDVLTSVLSDTTVDSRLCGAGRRGGQWCPATGGDGVGVSAAVYMIQPLATRPLSNQYTRVCVSQQPTCAVL